MGSTSFRGASGSGDSPNGLKFGQKIYFEDVGGGGSAPAAIAAAGSSSSNSEMVAASPGKKARGPAQAGRPPRCQVEGCHVDLTGSKAYYCRHKVCGMHTKTPEVTVAGLKQRFCQQCSRFHQLPEFDHGKRSCRRRLAGHNERRRKPPPGSLVPSRYGRIPSNDCKYSSKVGSYTDFSYSRMQGRDAWPNFPNNDLPSSNQITLTGKYLPNLFHGSYDIPSTNIVGHTAQNYLHGTSAETVFPGAEISAGETLADISGAGCALSLLSTPQWDPRNRSNEGRACASQPVAAHAPVATQFLSNAWGFKGYPGGGSSHSLSLHQFNNSSDGRYSAARELSQLGSRQFMEQEQSGGDEASSHQVNWSL